jgi:signal transduction histidine kinase
VYLTGRTFVEHELALTANGVRGYFDTTACPLRDVDGRVVGVSIFAVDITSYVEARTCAEIRRAEAERKNHAKDDALAIVSHELRNPLSAILGWAQFLRSMP